MEVFVQQESSPEPAREISVVSGRSGGWAVPDDSDAASVQDWNQSELNLPSILCFPRSKLIITSQATPICIQMFKQGFCF